ncbi:MAG: hypothetical protein P1U70_06270 [Saprospiraceae bacterium]|jgi:hypothetical protein|nr:hypothetical protein [Saprospiraceae bacterium]
MTLLKQELINGLDQFYGSEVFYYQPLYPQYRYTEGVKYLAEHAGVYWLLDYVFANQLDAPIKAEGFQVWELTLNDDGSAVIRVEDGNKNEVKRYDLSFTDFPLKQYSLWFIDGTLLLPSEY